MVAGLRLFVAAVCVAACAHTTGAPSFEEEAVAKYLDSLESFSAIFEQNRYDEYGELVETARGRCLIKRPGRFRWSYAEPYVQSIVSDGSSLWIYDKDLEQVTVNTISGVDSASPVELLGASEPIEERYHIGKRDVGDGYDWYRLTPKVPTRDFQWVEISMADGEIEIMRIIDNLRQLIVLNFKSIQTNMPVDDGVFNFSPPPGIDVIQGSLP